MTERRDSQATLQQLDQHNLFLIALDDQRQWYRYHHLFAEVLRSRLAHEQSTSIPELQRRASAWFEQHGLNQEAIEHAILGEDWVSATRVIKQHGDAMLKRSETSTLEQWLDALPEGIVRSQPRLCLFRAELCGLAHQLAEAEKYLQDAELSAQADLSDASPERSNILTQIRFLRTGLALNAGDLPRTITLAQEALKNLQPKDSQMRGWLLLRLGTALQQTGDLDGSIDALAESYRLSSGAGDLLTATYAADNLAGAYVFQAHLTQGIAVYQQALELCAARGAAHTPITGLIHADLGELLYEWNELSGAYSHLTEAVELGERGGLPRTLVNAYLQLVRVYLAKGDLPSARHALQKIKQLVEKYNLPIFFADRAAACEVRVWLAENNLSAAAGWAQKAGVSVDDELNHLGEVLHLALARVLIAKGELEQALGLLARLERAAHNAERTGSVIEIMALQTIAMFQRGDTLPALTILEHALTLAEPEGYVRTFVDEGEPMRRLDADCKLQIEKRMAQKMSQRHVSSCM